MPLVPDPSPSEQAAADRLAEKINRLFDVVHPRERGPYSEKEVERWLAAHADSGPTISANYLRFLRRAQRTNPAANSLRAIARFFEVDPGYLLSEDEQTDRIHEQLHLVGLLADARVRGIAARAADLDDPTRDWLLRLLETFPGARRSRRRPPGATGGPEGADDAGPDPAR